MVGILNPIGNGACWVSTLNCEVMVDGATFVLLAINLLSLGLSSFILLVIGENASGPSLLLDVANVDLASR